MIPDRIVRHPRRVALTSLAFAGASVSLVALLLHAAGWLPLYFAVDLLGAPSLMLLAVLGVFANRVREEIFFSRLATGAWAGLAATGAYDLIRLAIRESGLIHFDPFLSHPIFGRLITNAPETTTMAIVVGWAYHLWNGLGLGLMYVLVAGPAPWYFALAWALVLEIAWLATLPSVLHLSVSAAFVTVGFVGHGAYGVVLGLLAQRFTRKGELL